MYPKLFFPTTDSFKTPATSVNSNVLGYLRMSCNLYYSFRKQSFLFLFSICKKNMLDFFLFFWSFFLRLFSELTREKSFTAVSTFIIEFFNSQNLTLNFAHFISLYESEDNLSRWNCEINSIAIWIVVVWFTCFLCVFQEVHFW